MELTARHLKAGYDKNVIIEDMNLTVPAHKVTALIGANGCGKSTLLKTLCRIQPPLGGEVLLDGRSIFAEDSRSPRNSPSCHRIRRPRRGSPCGSSSTTGARRIARASSRARRRRTGAWSTGRCRRRT